MARHKITQAQVTVTGLDEQGMGVAHVQQKPLRVRNALPNEQVEARVLRKRKGTLFADALTVAQAHPQRRLPACEYFPRCGGCVTHHMAGSLQLQHKQQQLVDALARHQLEVERWRSPTQLSDLGYRRKARLGVRRVGEQVLVGFRESFSNRVARIDACKVLTPKLSALIAPLKALIGGLSNADQIPQVEMAQGDRDAAIIVRHLTPFEASDLQRWRDFEQQHQVQVLLQPKGYDTVHRVDPGLEVSMLTYHVPNSELTLSFYPWQFTQVNGPMNLALIERALGYLQPSADQHVIDLFCGLGNFSLPLAAAGARVSGYELSVEAVTQAQLNLAAHRLDGDASFYSFDLYQGVPEGIEQADALLLDPPRSGAGPHLMQWVRSSQCRRIVYVSCNPKTFAEDAAILGQSGFRLREVGVYDMFPHTAHVETMGCFERVDGAH